MIVFQFCALGGYIIQIGLSDSKSAVAIDFNLVFKLGFHHTARRVRFAVSKQSERERLDLKAVHLCGERLASVG
jgi:hypothetical protein